MINLSMRDISKQLVYFYNWMQWKKNLLLTFTQHYDLSSQNEVKVC